MHESLNHLVHAAGRYLPPSARKPTVMATVCSPCRFMLDAYGTSGMAAPFGNRKRDAALPTFDRQWLRKGDRVRSAGHSCPGPSMASAHGTDCGDFNRYPNGYVESDSGR